MMDSAAGMLTSFSSHDEPAGNQRPLATHSLHLRKVIGMILLHQPVTVGAGPVEDVIGILLEQRDVVVDGFGDEFADDLRVGPAPLGVQMRVTDQINHPLLGQVRRGISVPAAGDVERPRTSIAATSQT